MIQLCTYIVKCILHSFIVILTLLTSIAWISQSVRIVELILEKGVGILFFVKLSLLILPSLIYIIVPVAGFISIGIVYSKLQAEREIIILRSSGLNNIQIAIPAAIASLIIMILSFCLSYYILPASYKHFKELQSLLKNRYVSLFLQEGVFTNQLNNITVYVDKRDGYNSFKDIFVYNTSNNEHTATIMAKSGFIEHTKNGPKLKLINGSQQLENTKTKKMKFLFFDSYTLDIDMLYASSGIRKYDHREMYIHQLLASDKLFMRVHGHQRIIWPLYSFILPLICVGFLLSAAHERKKTWKPNIISSCICGIIIILSILFQNLSLKHYYFISLMYSNIALSIYCLYMIYFRNR